MLLFHKHGNECMLVSISCCIVVWDAFLMMRSTKAERCLRGRNGLSERTCVLRGGNEDLQLPAKNDQCHDH